MGTQNSSVDFTSALSSVYSYAYLSDTVTSAATAALAVGNTSPAVYAALTSASAVAAAAASVGASLFCASLAAALNGSGSNTTAAICLPSPPPPPLLQPTGDYTWIAVVAAVVGSSVLALGAYAAWRALRLPASGPAGRVTDPVDAKVVPAPAGLEVQQLADPGPGQGPDMAASAAADPELAAASPALSSGHGP